MDATGSMNMSYDSSNLTTPDIKWLGVRPSDLDRFNIPQQCRLAMTDEDIKMGKKLVHSSVEQTFSLCITTDLNPFYRCTQFYETHLSCPGENWCL